MSKKIYFLGYASSLGGPMTKTNDAPRVLQKTFQKDVLNDIEWLDVLFPDTNEPSKLFQIAKLNKQLAISVCQLVNEQKFFVVMGGDHSSAIGTWSGAYHAIKNKGDIGLIWIDAHMDSHTPETSPSGNIHGMPLACLLGYGDSALTHILDAEPKLKPENICLIGVRSFERGEAELLKKLKVKVFYMKEVKERGLEIVMKEALNIVTKKTAGFGVSFDIDAIDPKEAPGTGSIAPNGIVLKDLYPALTILRASPQLIGCEIVEFDPSRDVSAKTEKIIPEIIKNLFNPN